MVRTDPLGQSVLAANLGADDDSVQGFGNFFDSNAPDGIGGDGGDNKIHYPHLLQLYVLPQRLNHNLSLQRADDGHAGDVGVDDDEDDEVPSFEPNEPLASETIQEDPENLGFLGTMSFVVVCKHLHINSMC